MDGLGERLRARARELGLTDAEVARRAGLSSTRYANYVQGRRQPDNGTLVRLCRLLATTPDSLLAYSEQVAEHDKVTKLRDQITATAQGMDEPTLRTVVALMMALVGSRD